ncbi:MAG: tRNA threonylcarbamoyladenosine dehydratase [Duncaniella sp.]|nr:tRNA threonylcarbamoyladenosine dehydratase [Duncaniella sp.]
MIKTSVNREEIFNRTALLTGRRNLESFGQTRVIIFGIGGVGSWTAETLVRSGFANLTLVDADRIAMSNINRQLPATTKTVGEVKVEAMKQRLLEINPDARIVAIHDFYNEATQDNYVLTDYDVVIDAIDSLSDKARLILNATKAMAETAGSDRRLHFYSSMGAALKTDPSRIAVAEFWKVKGCPLAAALRRKFKKSGLFPAKKFKCVYSDELVANHPDAKEMADRSGAMTYNKVATNGAMMHITAIFGITLASLAIRDIMKP